MNRKILLLASIMVLGLYVRFSDIENVSFGFDQVQILNAADAIVAGDFTLIGPRTGPAQIFTGPAVYYITAGLKAVTRSVVAIALLSLILSIVTGLFLIVLSKKYLEHPFDILFLACWSLSPLIISFDRIPWNPGLTFLAASLVFFPLRNTKNSTRLDLFFITLGSFLGYQAHFSGFILPIIVFASCLLFKKSLNLLWCSFFGMLLSVMPTMIFDFRHGWSNVHGLFQLLSNQSSPNVLSTLGQIGNSLRITVETIGKILCIGNSYQLSLIVGIYVVVVNVFIMFKRKELESFISLIWLTLSAVMIGLYRGSKPEYYYFIVLPAACMMLAEVWQTCFSSIKYRRLLAVFLIAYSIMVSRANSDQELSLKNQRSAISRALAIGKNQTIKSIVLDIKPEHSYGFSYLLKNIHFNANGQNVHLIYPNQDRFSADPKNSIGIWLDPRSDTTKNYLTIGNVVISSEKNVQFYQDVSGKYDGYTTYHCVVDNKLTNTELVLINRVLGNPRYDETQKQLPPISMRKEWNVVEAFGIVGIGHEHPTQPIMLFIPSEGLASANQCAKVDFL